MSKELNQIMDANSQTVIQGPMAIGTITKNPVISKYMYENLDMAAYGTYHGSYEWSLFSSLLDGMQKLFKWEGLPEGMRSGDLERTIISAGRVKFIKVGNTYQFVRVAPLKWNKNNDIIRSVIVEPYLPRLTGKNTEAFKNVEIKNNAIGESLITRIYPFLKGTAEQYRNILINTRALTGKAMLKVGEIDQNQSFEVNDKGETVEGITMEDSVNDWMTGDNPFKVIKKGITGDVEFTNFDFTDNTEAFLNTMGVMWNKLLSSIGIQSNNVEGKQERLITGELEIQNVLEKHTLDAMLEYRTMASDQINKLFGLNTSVMANNVEPAQEQKEDNDDPTPEQ